MTQENAMSVVENETGLSVLPDLSGAEFATKEAFDQLVRSNFMPRIQLCGGSSDIVKEGKVQIGRFALVRSKEDFLELGLECSLLPISWRFAAMRFADKTEVFYDPNSQDFKNVQAETQVKDSRCAYGPQFLVWFPPTKEFATYFFGSTSARPEGRKMHQQLNKPTTMKSKLVSTPQNKWHVPVVLPCSTPLELPPLELATTTAYQFNHPPKSEIEESKAPAGANGEAAPVGRG